MDKFSRTNFYNQNLIDGILQNDLSSNDFNNFTFKRPMVNYRLTDTDIGRFDLLSLRFYGSINYWWIIAKVNNVSDVYNDMVTGTIIRIPALADIEDFYIKTRKKR